ncbi:hypothetical protein CQ020_03785 [Arthrobacter sp. MYb23]|uniref:phage tail assembly protein n=1 Tax=unclassified Arthrobacter TaxID=235627 RepID=UPI000CFA988F|nr:MULTISPECIES: phage tail assembly protein [unclassified Arthrobacter]PRB44340.1 hypothetical protein CQ038_03640 [Arthrobacter sp. MYb51]PRB98592.1 hypothetical protein CQ020_03785 [Arthrobacter sp. MYb23]
MSAIKLSDLQKGADEKYPDFEIEIESGKVVAFQPILRLDKEGRKAVVAALDIAKRFGTEETDEDWTDVYADAFRLTARSKEAFNVVKRWAGEDLTRWSYLFDEYQEKTNAGEA